MSRIEAGSPRFQPRIFLGLLLLFFSFAPGLWAAEKRAAILAGAGCEAEEAELYEILGGMGGWELVDRGHLHLIVKEAAWSAAMKNPAALGRLLAAGYFFHVRKSGPGVQLEIVDGQSGRLLAVSPWARFRQKPAEVLQKIGRDSPPAGLRIAVGEGQGPRTQEAAAVLREFLESAGLSVLDRKAALHVAVEHGLVADGASGDEAEKVAPMLGADLVLSVNSTEGKLSLTVLDMGQGSLAGRKEFSWKSGSELPEPVFLWLGGQLKLPERKKTNYFPELQIEALEPLYRGIAEYREGRYEAAVRAFQEASDLNDKFADALLWEAVCYDAMGFPELGKAMRRYAQAGLYGRGNSTPMAGESAEGLCFMGVSGPDAGASSALAAVVLDILLKNAGERVLLPENLAAWRQEYDSLAGVHKTEGPGWGLAPRFFVKKSLHGSIDAAGKVSWSLIDNREGKVLGRIETGGVGGPGAEFELQKQILLLLSESGPRAEEKPREWMVAGPVAELEKKKDSDDVKTANLALLGLLKLDPGNRQLWGAVLKRDGNQGGEQQGPGFEGILNFALRDELIKRLPENDPHRVWLELARIASFLPWNNQGYLCSGEKADPVEALAAFAGKHQRTPPGIMALYMLKYESLENRSFEEITSDWKGVREEMEATPGFEKLQGAQDLKNYAAHFEALGNLAAGRTELYEKLPSAPYPRRISPAIRGYDRVGFNICSFWMANEWDFYAIDRAYWPQEAGAALRVIYARRGNSIKVDAKWIREYPESLVFLNFCLHSLHEAEHDYGKKVLFPFQMGREYENYRQLVQFCRRHIPRHLERVKETAKFESLSGMPRRMVEYLQRYNFAPIISDEEFESIRKEMITAVDAMATRLSKPAEDGYGNYWRTMPRRFDVKKHPVWAGSPENARGPEYYRQREAEAAVEAFRQSPILRPEWRETVRRGDYLTWISREERAEILAGYQGSLERLYGRGFLSVAEMGFILDYGIMLFDGGRWDLAEPWFARVAAPPGSDLLAGKAAREIVLNAKLYQAYCLRRMKRESEAVVLANEVVEEGAGQNFGLINQVKSPERIYYHFGGEGKKLRSAALRLLREMRMPEIVRNHPQVRVVEIAAPLSREKTVKFYFRLPASRGQAEKPAQVLIFVPSWTHSGPEFCLSQNTWTRFCDQNNLVLCAPDFDGLMENSDSVYQFPQAWSGKATLDAVEQFSRKQPVAKEKLLVYGYGGGARYAGNFARFAPERCLAVAAFAAGDFGMRDYLPHTHSLKKLQGLPLAVSMGEIDGMRESFMGRYAGAFNEAARAEFNGAKLLWREWPGIGHWPTPQMEGFAQAFFLQATEKTGFSNWNDPPFVGDRRSGRVYKKGDAEIADIPTEWRQPLSGENLAKAWEGS